MPGSPSPRWRPRRQPRGTGRATLHADRHPLLSQHIGRPAEQRYAAPWTAWQSVIPTLMAATDSTDTDTLLMATPTSRTLQATLAHQMNTPSLLLKPLGAALRIHGNRKLSPARSNKRPASDCWAATLTLPSRRSHPEGPIQKAILLSQTAQNTAAHPQQPNCEAYDADDRCFQVSLARRLMLLRATQPTSRPRAQTSAPPSEFAPAPSTLTNYTA